MTVAAAKAAFADPNLAAYNEGSANQLTILTAGATAQDPGVERFFQLNQANNGLCQDGTLFMFRQSPDANGDIPNRLFFCTGNSSIAAVAGKTLAFFKGSTGGSGNGVGPLIRPASIQVPLWLVSTGGGSMTCTGLITTFPAAGVSASYTRKDGCVNDTTLTSAARPLDGGFSDVEPARFATNFTPNLSTAEIATINSQQAAAVIFGVPVSLNIRNKLQALTFGAADACVGSETLACQPSLTSKQLAALYSRNGLYQNWTAIKSRVVAGQDANSINGALAAPTVFICRRSNTSGTQATFQTHFFKQNCGIANSAVFAPINTATPQVIPSGGSPGVISCLEDRHNANQGGIGILSTEFTPGPGSLWRFIKVDGAPPCLLDAVRSNYSLIGEATMQWPNGVSATKLPVLQAVRSRLQSAAAVQDVNSLTPQLEMCKGNAGAGIRDRGFGALLAPFATNAGTAPVSPFCANASCGPAASDVQQHPVLLSTHNTGGPASCSAFRDLGNTEVTENTQASEQ